MKLASSIKTLYSTLLPLILIGLNIGCGKAKLINSKNNTKSKEKKKVQRSHLVILNWIEKELKAKKIYLEQSEVTFFISGLREQEHEAFALENIKSDLEQYIREAHLLNQNFPRKKYRWKQRNAILRKVEIAKQYLAEVQTILDAIALERESMKTEAGAETQVCDKGSELDVETLKAYKERFSQMEKNLINQYKINPNGSRKSKISDKNIKKLNLKQLREMQNILERFYYESLSFLTSNIQDQFPRETRIIHRVGRAIGIARNLIEEKENESFEMEEEVL